MGAASHSGKSPRPRNAVDWLSCRYAIRYRQRLHTPISSPGATTRWLANGVGIVALAESEQLADGSIRHRQGAVSSYNVITSVPLSPVANVGAHVLLTVSAVKESGAPEQYQWRKDGVAFPGNFGSQFEVTNVRPSDAGFYSVVSSNLAGEVSAPIATLRVTPFEES